MSDPILDRIDYVQNGKSLEDLADLLCTMIDAGYKIAGLHVDHMAEDDPEWLEARIYIDGSGINQCDTRNNCAFEQ